MKKKVCMLCIMLCFAMAGSYGIVYAGEAEDSGIEPYAQNYQSVTANISSSSAGTIKATGIIVGKVGYTTKLSAQLSLQRYSGRGWITVGTWTETTNDSVLAMSKTKAVPKGYKYRTKAVFTAYAGTKSEKITKYSGTLSY
ncbi:MAG: hypothetical protein U0M21_08450 [Emergencia sp.]|nr:hypothetical protein [Emergencia sp.]